MVLTGCRVLSGFGHYKNHLRIVVSTVMIFIGQTAKIDPIFIYVFYCPKAYKSKKLLCILTNRTLLFR